MSKERSGNRIPSAITESGAKLDGMKSVSGTAASAAALAALFLSFSLVGIASGQEGGDSNRLDLDTVMARATGYVSDYEEQLGTLIGEEEYVQDAAWLGPTFPRTIVARDRRRLSSDFLLLQVRERWYGVRNVLRVDGVPVEVPDVFPESLEEVLETRTDAQYNIGDFARNFNVPTFALTFLRSGNLGRFSFEQDGGRTIEGVRAWEIRFSETVSPTLVRGANGEDRPAHGIFRVDPETGRVFSTEVVFEGESAGARYRVTMRVGYQDSPELGMMVPATMEEHYDSDFHTVDARAEYRNFQRFRVQVDVMPEAVR